MRDPCPARPCLLDADDATLTALIEQLRAEEGFSSPAPPAMVAAPLEGVVEQEFAPPRLSQTILEQRMRVALGDGNARTRTALYARVLGHQRRPRDWERLDAAFGALMVRGEVEALLFRVGAGARSRGRIATYYRLAARQEQSA